MVEPFNLLLISFSHGENRKTLADESGGSQKVTIDVHKHCVSNCINIKNPNAVLTKSSYTSGYVGLTSLQC
jgi:hypothetical protein